LSKISFAGNLFSAQANAEKRLAGQNERLLKIKFDFVASDQVILAPAFPD